MSHTLTLELNDQIYRAIERQAEAAGISPIEWALRTLERYHGPREICRIRRSALTEDQKTKYAQELAELNTAYAEEPTPNERETERRLWEVQKQQMAREPW